MFGAFRPSARLNTGPIWMIPFRMKPTRKARHRRRLKAVDTVISTIDNALARAGLTFKKLETWKATMPTESEMKSRDKYTVFARNEKSYRKGIHKMPKWTRISQRVNPPGF